MFDLEREIEDYLQSLGGKRSIHRSYRDEIESHLRDAIDQLISRGQDKESAFRDATDRIGAGCQIGKEYTKLSEGRRMSKVTNVLSYYLDPTVITKAFFGVALGSIFMMTALMLEGGHVSSVLQVTSFVLVVGTACITTLASRSSRDVIRSYVQFLRGGTVESQHFRVVGRNFLNAGFIGAFIGLIDVVAHLNTPELVGPRLAISIVSMLYGFFGYLFFGLAFEAWAESDDSVADDEFHWTQIIPFVLVAVAIFAAMYFGLGLPGALGLVHVPGVVVVSSGVVTVLAFLRKFRRNHYSYLGNGALCAGVVGCIINFIRVMENLDKPDMIFVGLSVAMVPLFYGVVIAVVMRCMAERSRNIIAVSGSDNSLAIAAPLTGYCLACVAVLVASILMVMYALNLTAMPG